MFYYSCFIILFQFGWACVQISHLALVTQLSDKGETRTLLTSLRYLGTVVANVLVYAVTWLFFGLEGGNNDISSKDSEKFRNVMLVGVGVGCVTTALFHILVREPDTRSFQQEALGSNLSSSRKSYLQWLLNPKFYLVGVVYTASRLFVNLSQSYIPLYLQDSILSESTKVAIIPLVMFISGFIMSFFVNPLHRLFSEELSWCLGGVVGACAAVWLYLDVGGFFLKYGIFIVSIIYGAANSLLLITSLALTANLIGSNTDFASFIYGLMSLMDKVANGISVLVIQNEVSCLKLYNSEIGDMGTTAGLPMNITTMTTPSPNLDITGPGCDQPYNLEATCFKFFRTVLFTVTGSLVRMSDYKVYIGNLPEDIRDRDIEKLFRGYGKIHNIVLKGNYGFCEFEDGRDAEDAVRDLDGSREFGGSRLRLEHARESRLSNRNTRRPSPPRKRGNPPGRKTGYRLIVENLSTKTSWQDLKDFMRQAGEITYTNTHHQRPGEGVVEFGSRSDMEYALDKLDGEEVDGRRIKLVEESRGRSRSRSRSRRSRSRSRRSRSRSRRSRSRSDRSRSKSKSRRSRSRSRS